MHAPRTPQKVKEIEQLKESLTEEYGLRFPTRGTYSSPSKRDHDAAGEKALGHIQLLWFNHRPGLYEAVRQFKTGAPKVISQWQFKPGAEYNVLPPSEADSQLSNDFRSRKATIDVGATDELMKHLESLLANAVTCRPKRPRYAIQKPLDRHNEQETVAQSLEGTTAERNLPHRSQEPPQSNALANPPAEDSPGYQMYQIPPQSSEEYPFEFTDDILHNKPILYPPGGPHRSPAHAMSPSPRTERFTTPPESPGSAPDSPTLRMSQLPTKRRVDPSGAENLHPRKVSREDISAFKVPELLVRKRAQVEDLINYQVRGRNTERQSGTEHRPSTHSTCSSDMPTATSSMTTSFNSNSSFATSRNTSRNTSFTMASETPSFESGGDETDTTVRPRNIGHQPKPLDHLVDPEILPDADLPTNAHQDGLSLPSINEKVISLLQEHTPFALADPGDDTNVSLRQLYEVTRVALSSGISLQDFSPSLREHVDEYRTLWSSLSTTVKDHGTKMPEKSSSAAWENAGFRDNCVSMSGRLTFSDAKDGSIFNLSLSPLRNESSYRFSRKFGSDRLFVLLLPGLENRGLPKRISGLTETFPLDFATWLSRGEHKFLGRTWRAFFIKSETKKTKKDQKWDANTPRYRVYFFAENAKSFRPRDDMTISEYDYRQPEHPRLGVDDIVEWFMPSKNNLDKAYLKYFSRLGLGMTSTVPTVLFKACEILRTDDALADNFGVWQIDIARSDEKKTGRNPVTSKASVMNDGCSRISRAAAKAVAAHLQLDHLPSVFQGRIGGAKGLWMVDVLDEDLLQSNRGFWIEINDSQLKFEGHDLDSTSPDPHRVTLEISSYSKPLSSSFLNFQLLPILLNNGVPRNVFEQLVEEDLSAKVQEMQAATHDGLALRKWNQSTNAGAMNRHTEEGLEMCGGIPNSTPEMINFLVDHGFGPMSCKFLQTQVQKAIKTHCHRLRNKMNVAIGQSSTAFMIADPLGVLEENEVHIRFSQGIKDAQSGFDDTILHGLDVLVARLPAHLPSDIQKVRAVFKHELRDYKDVIIFPAKGQVSLANKLSGGDYDGDKAWICWDDRMVKSFRNVSEVPTAPKPEHYGIELNETTVREILPSPSSMTQFLTSCFQFALRQNMLPTCTLYHEAMCYADGSIHSPRAIEMASLLGLLVDSAKSGFIYDDNIWLEYLKKKNLPQSQRKPAYKTPENRPRRTDDNFIDHLVFNVTEKAIDGALTLLHRDCRDVPSYDSDLVRIRDRELENAKSDACLATVLEDARREFDKVNDYWRRYVSSREGEDELLSNTRQSTRHSKGNGEPVTFKSVAQKCRDDFLAIPPVPQSRASRRPLPSTIVERWAQEHEKAVSGYWDLVKASLVFEKYKSGSFIWYTAGLELAEIKAQSRGRGSYRTVVAGIHRALKTDTRMVDRIKKREEDDQDEGSIRALDEINSQDDEFGEMDMSFYDFE